MKRFVLRCSALAALAAGLSTLSLRAAEDPAHAELRELRTQVIAAIEKGDFDACMKHVTPNIVVTWQNAEVCRGPDSLREFMKKMGTEAFKGYKVPPTPDDLTILYGGDTGVSFGKVVANYNLLGKDYQFTSRYTATLVKENGRWLLASYHVSVDALDNPLLNAAKNSLILFTVGAGAIGLFIGFLLTRTKQAP